MDQRKFFHHFIFLSITKLKNADPDQYLYKICLFSIMQSSWGKASNSMNQEGKEFGREAVLNSIRKSVLYGCPSAGLKASEWPEKPHLQAMTSQTLKDLRLTKLEWGLYNKSIANFRATLSDESALNIELKKKLDNLTYLPEIRPIRSVRVRHSD